jgi:hypothetical protein
MDPSTVNRHNKSRYSAPITDIIQKGKCLRTLVCPSISVDIAEGDDHRDGEYSIIINHDLNPMFSIHILDKWDEKKPPVK